MALCKGAIIFGSGARPEPDLLRWPDALRIGSYAVLAFGTDIIAFDRISRRARSNEDETSLTSRDTSMAKSTRPVQRDWTRKGVHLTWRSGRRTWSVADAFCSDGRGWGTPLLLHSAHGSSIFSRLLLPGMEAVSRLERRKGSGKGKAKHCRTDGRICRESVLKARDAADKADEWQLPIAAHSNFPGWRTGGFTKM